MTLSSVIDRGIHRLRFYYCILSLLGFLAATPVTHAAMNAYAELTIDGVPLVGYSSRVEMGGMDVSNNIECYAVNWESYLGDTGALMHTPIKIIKRIDKATPLLVGAMDNNQTVEGTIRFFAPDPDSGAVVHVFSFLITGGRIAGVRTWQTNTLDTAVSNWPLTEEISIRYAQLTFVSEQDAQEYTLSATAP